MTTKPYEISIHGCDDSTYFVIDLNEEQLHLLEEICKKSKENSSYSCMPIMEIEEA